MARWDRVMPAPAPRMTTAQAANTQPRPAQNSMGLQRFEKVGRTCRFEAASRARTTEERQHRRDQPLIAADKKTHEKEHQGARIEARSARRNHSSFSSSWLAFAA